MSHSKTTTSKPKSSIWYSSHEVIPSAPPLSPLEVIPSAPLIPSSYSSNENEHKYLAYLTKKKYPGKYQYNPLYIQPANIEIKTHPKYKRILIKLAKIRNDNTLQYGLYMFKVAGSNDYFLAQKLSAKRMGTVYKMSLSSNTKKYDMPLDEEIIKFVGNNTKLNKMYYTLAKINLLESDLNSPNKSRKRQTQRSTTKKNSKSYA